MTGETTFAMDSRWGRATYCRTCARVMTARTRREGRP